MFVSVNETVVSAARAAPFMVMVPHSLDRVTLVDLLVAWVVVPPAPVAYPTPLPVPPLEVIAPVTAKDVPVAAPIAGVVNDGDVIVWTPVKVFAASVLATVKLASGTVMVRAAVAPEMVNNCEILGTVVFASGRVIALVAVGPAKVIICEPVV